MDTLYPGIRRIIKKSVGGTEPGGKGAVQCKEGESFYRLLEAFRGVSEALVYFAGQTGRIRWVRLGEERF